MLNGRRGLWTLCAALWLAAPAAAAVPTGAPPLSLEGRWKFRTGDDAAWSRPDLDDAAWTEIEVPTGWGPIGYDGPPAALSWYRKTVVIPRADRIGLGLTMGPVDSAYELFLGGQRAGGAGSMPPTPREDYDRRVTYRVPPGAIGADGRLVIAVRVWTPATISRAGGLYDGPILLGPIEGLARREVTDPLPLIVLAVVFAVVGLSHLSLGWRGREHVWFGVMSVGTATYTLLRSPLKYHVFESFQAAKEVEHFQIYFFSAAIPEFLWPLLGRPFRPWHRAYQAGSLLVGLVVALTPGLTLNLRVLPWYEATFTLFACYMAALVIDALRRGVPEARAVAVGFFALAGACLHDSALDWGLIVGPRLVPLGFAVMVVAMTVTLNRRFRRMHHDLVALRQDLEARVATRTAALETQSRELTEAGAAKTRFLASVSHEIRTPLNGILGVNRMLLQSLAAGRARELSEIVQSQGRALLAIINDILDYSKMEAGRFALEPTDFALRRTVNDAVRVYREQAKAKGLELVLEMDPAFPPRVHGDAVRLRQIIDNLLANAVKFTEKGSVHLRVQRVAAADDGVLAHFEVEDTGIGLDPAILPSLFTPFTQADASTTRRYGGTGLGLAIAKGLVEMMGGTIGGTGTPGKGARFWISVPLGPAQSAAGPATPQDVRLNATRPAGRALVAEDNAINRMVTVALLEEAGWAVDVAANGVQAVDAFAARRYDLVLLDCRMPEMDGYAAAREMRRREGRGHTPIVALTAHAVPGEDERCRAAGMDDYLTKPVSPGMIAQVIERWPPQPLDDEEPSAVDVAVLADLERRSPQVLKEVLTHYLRATPGEIQELRAAAVRGDLEQLGARAHDLVGSALLVGARELARRLRALEAADGPSTVQECLALVEEEGARVQRALAARHSEM